MSYELNRLMQQYGVSAPGANYGGAAMPNKPAEPGPNATAAEVSAYNALAQKYNLEMPKHLADQEMFNKYKVDYQTRVGQGSIYDQDQFNTGEEQRIGINPPPLFGPAYGTGTYSGAFTPLGERAAPLPLPPPLQAFTGGGSNGGGMSTVGGVGGVGGITNGTGTGAMGNTMVDGVSGPTTGIYSGMNSLAAVLGNMGLTTLSDAIAKNVDPNYSHEGRNALGGGVDAQTGLQGQGASGQTGSYGDAAAGAGTSGYGGGGDAPGANDGGYGGGDAGFGGGSQAFARGGRVKRKFADGGLNDLAEGYGISGPPDTYQSAEMNRALQAAAAQPQMAPTAPTQVSAPPEMDMQALLQRYLPNPVDYSSDIAESRKALSGYNTNFNKLLERAMTQKAAGPSKAELYFNLAAAFGTPGKTGNFFEQLGGAGKVLGEHNKAQRENERDQQKTALMLGMKQQEMGAEGERSNLTTLRQLAAEGAKDQRAVTSRLLENYIQSGKPQSAAGKQAQDEGFQPGTPAFNKRVAEVGNMLVEKQMAQINAIVAGQGAQQGNLAVAQGNLGVAQGNLALKAAQAARAVAAGTKLTPGEMKIKLETEDLISQTDQAIAGLEKAYELNPNTFDTSLVDIAQRKMLEAVGSKDKKVVDTREQENLLEKAALSQLKATFPGAISNDERKVLMSVQGLGAKSIEERAKIIKSGAKALKSIRARAADRLSKVAAGEYRTAVAAPEPAAGD